MQIMVLFVGIVIIIRLLFLQVIGAGGYKEASKNQAVKRKIVVPARGLLLDRKQRIILNNDMFYNLTFQPRKLKKQADFDTARLCQLLDVPVAEFDSLASAKIMLNGWDRDITLYKNLSPEAVARLQEAMNDFVGIDLVESAQRTYPYNAGASFVGYINEVTKEMLEKEKFADYRQGDMIGITGLEKTYENVLRGSPGVQYLLQDVRQRIIGPYKNGTLDSMAVPGKDLQLYLDIELQQLAEKMMANKLGSAIAIEPETGGILAFVSSPTYDPNLQTGSDKSKNLQAILRDPRKLSFNRAVSAKYPPGSTFKPLTALVGLDMGVITSQYGYPCNGGYYKCGKRIGCTHSGHGHASNITNAIANSCNAYFCHVFRLSVDSPANKNVREGVKRWGRYMSDFGLGHPIGIDFPVERGGNIPNVEYFDRVYNKNWNSCNMAILGMGQGELELTPLQMANSMCILANKGYYRIPHFVKSIADDSTHEMLQPFLEKKVVANISKESFEAVIEGMHAVVEFGTARIAKINGIEVCGKTGTVENYTLLNGKRIKLKNHSVFVAFAPKDKPKIAVAVIVENSGYGATWAGPIASLMMEQYLNDSISDKRKYLVDRMSDAKLIPSIVYIKDSIERRAARERWQKELRRRDSIKQLKRKRQLEKLQQSGKDGSTVFKWWKSWALPQEKKKIDERN